VPTPALHYWHVPPPSHAFDRTPALPSPLLLRLHRWCVLVEREDEARESDTESRGRRLESNATGLWGFGAGSMVEMMWGPRCGPIYIQYDICSV
jgi:hypothetical protein